MAQDPVRLSEGSAGCAEPRRTPRCLPTVSMLDTTAMICLHKGCFECSFLIFFLFSHQKIIPSYVSLVSLGGNPFFF